MYNVIKKIDAHVHLTSFTFAQDLFTPKEDPSKGDCVKACLKMMDRYGIDQCLAQVAQGASLLPLENNILLEIAEKIPERLAGILVGFSQPKDKPWAYDSQKAAAEIEEYLKHPMVKGLGELAIAGVGYMAGWPEVWERLRPVFDVLAKYNAVALIHTGAFPQFDEPGKERVRSTRSLYFSNPILVDDIAVEYPDVPIILSHAGVQGFFYYGSYADMALTVAARNPNVYIETSSVPYEVLLKCVEDPAIGPEKLIFGTDTPAFFSYYKSPSTGEMYPSYGKTGKGEVMPDHYKYDMDNIYRLPVTDVQRQMIMGGTLAEILAQKHE